MSMSRVNDKSLYANPVLASLYQQGFRFQTNMGQHFLFNSFLLQQIVHRAGIEAGDVVIEAGAGAGSLSEVLANMGTQLIAIELDRALIPFLQNRFRDNPAVDIVHGDVMKLDLDRLAEEKEGKGDNSGNSGECSRWYKLCANLPYNISTPFITLCFRQWKGLASGAVLLQKEVADKVTAKPGEDGYGMLSLAANWYGKVEQAMDIDPNYFIPRPPVDSALVTFTHIPHDFAVDEKALWLVIRALFNQRRKNVQNGLKSLSPMQPRGDRSWATVLELSGIDAQRRPETLSLMDFVSIVTTAGYTAEEGRETDD